MKPTSRVVLFRDGRADLYLSGVTRNPDGSLKAGEVENGSWRLEIRDGEVLAKGWQGVIVNRWPLPDYEEVPVKPQWRGDYNNVMRLAQETYDQCNRV
jgi:hypothetical protein